MIVKKYSNYIFWKYSYEVMKLYPSVVYNLIMMSLLKKWTITRCQFLFHFPQFVRKEALSFQIHYGFTFQSVVDFCGFSFREQIGTFELHVPLLNFIVKILRFSIFPYNIESFVSPVS
jgi:hypothetical protein